MAEASILPPQQHKQPSRKGKKAWRKNVDITEVQDGLEEVREEVIKHGGVIAERDSAELFVTDTTGSKDIQKAYARANKLLKADEILAQRSAVPSVATHKRPAGSRVTDGLVEPSSKRRRDYVSRKEYERLRKFAYGGNSVHKDVVKQGDDADYDPWAAEASTQPAELPFLAKKNAVREPVTLKQAPISLAKSGKAISAVRKPEAGKSYNPLFEDWEALIQREGDKAVAEERQRLEEERQEEERQAMIAKAQAEEDTEHWESEWESEWEGIMSEKEDAEQNRSWLRKKRPERKTPAERNKIKRRKQEEQRKRHEEKMRTRDLDLAQLKALAKENRNSSSRPQAEPLPEESSSSEGEDIKLRRRRPKHVPEAPLEVVLADELEDSLRRLRPEGNLLQDRYRSMILRGKIESRAKITQPKKPKREVKEKWSYKDWKLK
ncbi:uncharacterized protein PV09_08788 [Verruconis gallopava]|uniref:Ribosome biogenesis protein NOP53 n=1 Tax=Verruconis gallopava TaxID=253628 RepID=A0A0D2AKS3_9PEZI|nr:uncharacterized protein PV09_08788 [Verruconis gallopava]KIV99613.1 hypothetical protein PV09_08788 [Verruconis gallopava]